MTTSLEQTNKINAYKISLHNVILWDKFTSKDEFTDNNKTSKNALILIVKNLNKIKNTNAIEHEPKPHMGLKKRGQYVFQNWEWEINKEL